MYASDYIEQKIKAKEDIAWIKHVVSTKENNYLECRRLLLVLIYAYRKCSTTKITIMQNKPKRVNYTSLSRLSNIDARKFGDALNVLKVLGIIKLSQDKNYNLQMELLKTNKNILNMKENNVQYKRLPTICNQCFQRKINKKY